MTALQWQSLHNISGTEGPLVSQLRDLKFILRTSFHLVLVPDRDSELQIPLSGSVK